MGAMCSSRRSVSIRAQPVAPPQEIFLHCPSSKPILSDTYFPPGFGIPTLQDLSLRTVMQMMLSNPQYDPKISELPQELQQKLHDTFARDGCFTEPTLNSFKNCQLTSFKLNHLSIDDNWFKGFCLWKNSTLNLLDISSCGQLTDKSFSLLPRLSHLTTLVLDGCASVTDASLGSISSITPLRALSVNNCTHLTSKCLDSFPPGLLYLSLQRCYRMQDVGLGSLSKYPELQHLDLGWCIKLTPHGLDVIKVLKALRHLRLCRTQITNVFLIECLGYLSHLETLGIGGCDHITDEGIAPLRTRKTIRSLSLEYCPITDVSLTVLSALPVLTELNLAYTRITDTGVSNLMSGLRLPLSTLNLDSCAVGDASIKALTRSYESLTILDLTDTLISDGCMTHLIQLKNLISLDLSCTNLGDDCVPTIAALPPTLKILNLDTKNVTDASLKYVGKLTGLISLDLFGAKITDAGLAPLVGLTQLVKLEICGGGLTDLGMRTLARMTSLTHLNLTQNFRITDNGLKHLHTLKTLRTLIVAHTRVTGGGLRHLVLALPCLRFLGVAGCKISKSSLEKLQGFPQITLSGV
eukprot:TRINITY_DN19366_c0_g1::TRINITY_DN19366_c0_g1_i1::g.7809::m.7809 TRINITY_DN19366_c0_g1::TRINITY_DN19366_c0_g1_i1::g.7809  ORF type:complete len:580 (-),score=36.17,sp/Q8N1E6/FXL14_HUMAN/29.62/3e-16,sp/Q8N1E6/FXL14_HUMAN/27.35/3e-13,LRR_4/PF12799.2/1.9e+03,LRR_4/PF12799.2/10,LRR_4/PF12799.2/40,LRR_4/PF12799.2/25,LRR_4/PF12799.2/0.0081,LRR_4/PF12799.2/3.9e-05,LRR_4/PF12799.2/0.02,LRR_4/PF12799.2/0.0059,LRR_4/PF12799.2/4.1,LRR_4/PF12799.2/1.9,LRR_4/PF12799.2/0.0088,LRR_4/PF12799.2/0.011,LRR_4/PF1279